MQDFIKQSSAHKRHQCCAILDHINIFQSRIIFQQRDKAQKNMSSRYQHKILNLPGRGAGGCLSTRASRGARAGCEQGRMPAICQRGPEHSCAWQLVAVLRAGGGFGVAARSAEPGVSAQPRVVLQAGDGSPSSGSCQRQI